jgi:hypothetical protein
MVILDRTAINQLNSRLNLPATGNEQDWEIELANPNRLNDFIDFFESKELNNNEKLALMALLLASYEEGISNRIVSTILWNNIEKLIVKDKEIYQDLLEYWTLSENNEPETFNITPFIRRLIQIER